MEDGAQHLVDLNIAETTQFRNEARALHVKEVQNNDRGSTREPTGVRNAGGHTARSATGERTRLQTGVSRAVLAYAEDVVVLATSRKVVKQMILDSTEGFRDTGLEQDHAKTNWSTTLKPQDPQLQAEDSKAAWIDILIYVGIA